MIKAGLTKRYAKALLELAQAKQQEAAFGRNLHDFVALLQQNEELAQMIYGKLMSTSAKKQLIEKITGAKLLGGKDKNQRKECGCMESVEIGAYHTCLNGCKYCYANFNEAYVKETVKLYRPDSSLLCGCVTSEDKITVRKMKSLKEIQGSFLV